MKNFTLILGFMLISIGTIWCQYATVKFDLEKNYFNEGQPLPVEKNLMFTGAIPQRVNIIEIGIYPSNASKERHELYDITWRSTGQADKSNFSIAINYKLRPSQKYDFKVDYYRILDGSAQVKLTSRLIDLTQSYLVSTVSRNGNKVDIAKGGKRILRDLNGIVDEALKNYRTEHATDFEGFSETILQKLEQIEDYKLVKNRSDLSDGEKQAKKEVTFEERLDELKEAISYEVKQLMDQQWSKLITSRYVDDYETEEKKGSFTLNFGYGAVYLGGNLNNLTYGSSPYAGVAFPFGNQALAPQFLRNSSLTLGVFFENFTSYDGNTVSGLLIDRPFYLGLDYKLFEFIRFNAGAAFLEEREEVPNGDGININRDVLIKPFIGLSARINLSVGFGK